MFNGQLIVNEGKREIFEISCNGSLYGFNGEPKLFVEKEIYG